MATAAASTRLVPPAQTAAVKAIDVQLTPIATRERELAAKLDRFSVVLNHPFASLHQEEAISIEERLEARAEIDTVRAEHARVELTRRRLEAERQRALDAEKERVRAALHAKKKAAVVKLKARLLVAKDASDELRDVQHEEHTLLGEPFDSLHWQEFGDRLQVWLATARSYGLLDD